MRSRFLSLCFLVCAAISSASNAQPPDAGNRILIVERSVIPPEQADAIIAPGPGFSHAIDETFACPPDPCASLIDYDHQWLIGRLPGGLFLGHRDIGSQAVIRIGDLRFASFLGMTSLPDYPAPAWTPELPGYRLVKASAAPSNPGLFAGVWRKLDGGTGPLTLLVLFRGDSPGQSLWRGCGNHQILGTSDESFDHVAVGWSHHGIEVLAAFITLPRPNQRFRILRLFGLLPALPCARSNASSAGLSGRQPSG